MYPTASTRHTAVFESAAPDGRGWDLILGGLIRRHVARRLDEVCSVLAEADVAAHRGEWAAVLVGYEAAGAFDRAARAQRDDGVPLVEVSVYETGTPASRRALRGSGPSRPGPEGCVAFHPSIDADQFQSWVRAARTRIADGDIYQVNLTFPLTSSGGRRLERMYDQLRAAQQAPYCALLDTEDHQILSLSPELFFSRAGNTVIMRPMKGTSRRGRWWDEDGRLARELVASPKERAENVMIVDLVRNDIGRVARVGSVSVPVLFEVERYPTLWQLTSTVQASVPTGTSIVDLFRAMFPCGSVTGAPKLRAMEVIAEYEPVPRGWYTGAIGCVAPGGDCTFSVAIRTIVYDRRTGLTSLGVGAGITWDSLGEAEYRECLLKADFVATSSAPPTAAPFELLETMRLENGQIARLERHLARIKGSACYFSYPWREGEVRRVVGDAACAHAIGLWRLRLSVDRNGTPAVSCTPHADVSGRLWRVSMAASPVDRLDPFLFNKTSRRGVYDSARADRADCDDVLLWNERGELTESTIANLVVEIDGRRFTPPLECGLLPGTLRAELVEQGALVERPLTLDDLHAASGIWLINSLRGWMPVAVVD